MKAKGKFLLIVLLLIIVISFPGVALAQFDNYGLDAEGRLYKGTLDNWDALIKGLPPFTYNPKGTDIIFVVRKWDNLFDPMLQGNRPAGTGAWQKVEQWEYLSGNQLGWTWHLDLEVVYSPENPIHGAIVLPPEVIGGFTGFYGVNYNEWLEGPRGEKTVINDFSINRSVIQKALHF
ncbi:MAG: hypothetical protein Q8911_04960 [Bacillota bacterium]|nr:hypothetical protein [Bacillota bacterium]